MKMNNVRLRRGSVFMPLTSLPELITSSYCPLRISKTKKTHIKMNAAASNRIGLAIAIFKGFESMFLVKKHAQGTRI